MVRSDSDIKRDVEYELRWDPELDATDVAVAVKSGVVTLTGFVKSYPIPRSRATSSQSSSSSCPTPTRRSRRS